MVAVNSFMRCHTGMQFEFVLHLFLFVQRLLQALSHSFVLLHAGGDCLEALSQLLCPGFSHPQATLQVLSVLI